MSPPWGFTFQDSLDLKNIFVPFYLKNFVQKFLRGDDEQVVP
jgi:hypothetical protein